MNYKGKHYPWIKVKVIASDCSLLGILSKTKHRDKSKCPLCSSYNQCNVSPAFWHCNTKRKVKEIKIKWLSTKYHYISYKWEPIIPPADIARLVKLVLKILVFIASRHLHHKWKYLSCIYSRHNRHNLSIQ